MSETHYLISDASKKVDVESHVLRYWEEELEMDITRNEKGHLYYTDFHIRLFKQIKEIKEKGYQIKRFPADWGKYGKKAGIIRNRAMAEYADALLAYWDGKSSGTRNMIEIARELGLKVGVKIVS